MLNSGGRTGPLADVAGVAASLSQTANDAQAGVATTVAPPRLPGYEIIGELGRGGMGVVYQAKHIGLKRIVALKMILAGAHASPEQRGRFLSEAHAVARLQHPNVVQIYDIGEHDGCPFFALEFIGGGSLAQKLDGTPLPPRQAAAMLSTLASAVQSAHEQNIVHRDLKPANILLTDKGMPKITDFGLAKEMDDKHSNTRSGAIVGTPCYMAPEQALGRSGQVGPETDVYALGAILYEMLTGRPPLRGETPMDTMMLAVSQEPVPPTQLQPKIPRDLELICLKCLSKERRRRFASATQLAEELRRFLKGEPLLYTRPVGRAERTWRWCRRNPLVAVLMLLVVLSLTFGMTLSSALAVHAYLAAGRAEREKQHAEREQARAEQESTRADAKAAEAEASARQARQDRFEAQFLSAGLSLSQGQTLCERGDVGRGLLWFAHSMQLLPRDAPNASARERIATLDHAIRLNVDGWQDLMNPPVAALEHGGWVNSAAFSPDGRLILTGSDDRTARLWDARTGAPLGSPIPHPSYVSQIRWSPDSQKVLIAGWDGTARLWNAGNLKPISPPLQHKGRVIALALTSNGNTVVTAAGTGEIRLWSAANGEPIGDVIVHPDFSCLAFSPDDQTLATGGRDGFVRFWDPATSKAKDRPLDNNKTPVLALCFQPDGKRLVVGAVNNMARFWDVATATPSPLPPLQHRGWVSSIAFHPRQNRLATASSDHTARLWDATTGQMIGVPLQHRGLVRALAFSSDGNHLATASADSTARLWNAQNGFSRGAWLVHQGEVGVVAFSPDSRTILTGSHDKTARLWHLSADGPLLGFVTKEIASSLSLSPNGKHLLVGGGVQSRLYALDGTRFSEQPMVKSGYTTSVAFASDNQRFVTGHPREAGIWNVATGRPVHVLRHPKIVYSVAFQPSGNLVATGCEDGKVRLFDAGTGKPDSRTFDHPDIIYGLAFSPDGRTLATGCEDGNCRLWDLALGTMIGTPMKHPGSVRRLVFTPDGRTLVTGCADGAVRLWNPTSGASVGPALVHAGEILALAVSGDGKSVVAGTSEGTMRMWDLASGKTVGPPRMALGPVEGVAFHPDGTRCIVVSRDTVLRVWKTPRTGDEDSDRVRLSVQALTGMMLSADGAAQMLSVRDWQAVRKSLGQR
jgi:WD40 repeat protein